MLGFHFTDPDKGRYKDLAIFHSLDMWHGAKSLSKKISAVSIVYGLNSL